jgi:hypothetical protein
MIALRVYHRIDGGARNQLGKDDVLVVVKFVGGRLGMDDTVREDLRSHDVFVLDRIECIVDPKGVICRHKSEFGVFPEDVLRNDGRIGVIREAHGVRAHVKRGSRANRYRGQVPVGIRVVEKGDFI